MTHVLIIRFHYEENDPRFWWRLAYFKAMVWPRIEAQENKDFDIAVRCNPWQDKFFKEISERIICFRVRNEAARYKTSTKNGKTYFEDFAPWEDVEGLREYDIQSGLDSDDLITPDYMALVRANVQEFRGSGIVHVHFQPQLFRLSTLRIMPMAKYGPTRGSAFLSLYQPKGQQPYHFIYERSHIVMPRIAEKTIFIPAGHAWASAHDVNESTGK